jgi:2,3-bisphosphoglycerate-dependent phosphoglycerate mutase
MVEAWFIRHGQSVSNADLPTAHPAQSELTPQGWLEAEQIVRAFTRQPDLLVLSPYLRAQQTAEPTLNRFPNVPSATWPVHEFTYLAAHHYDGTTGSERRPVAMTYWERNDPHYRDGPEAETFAELVERVWAIIGRLRQGQDQYVALFSHGLFIRALLWAVLTDTRRPAPQQMKQYGNFCQAVRVPNGSVCRLYIGEKELRLGSIDTSHLRER